VCDELSQAGRASAVRLGQSRQCLGRQALDRFADDPKLEQRRVEGGFVGQALVTRARCGDA